MKSLRTVLAALALVAAAMAGQTSDKSEAVSSQNTAVRVQNPPTGNRKSAIGDGSDAITIPQMMSYQGRLTDASGEPVADALYAVRFRLYAQPTGGTPLWEEEQQVRTKSGLFSVLLGSVTPITTGDGDRGSGIEAAYIGMAVEGSEEMTPRLRFAGTCASPRDGAGTSYVPPGGTDSDYDWVRIGSDSVLYTIHRLGLVRGESQNKLYGTYGYTQTIFGSSCTTGASGYNVGNIAIGGGYGNRAWAPFTAVCGGRNNKAGNEPTDTSAIVVGGYGNQATGKFATVGGGYGGSSATDYATVGGGCNNTASGSFAAICGGDSNVASGDNAFVGGGMGNTASGGAATVGGGHRNTASGVGSTVGGGHGNASYHEATVGGGCTNTASGEVATVGGGQGNTASRYWATVGGGLHNTASGEVATVGGGDGNTASGENATVPGGFSNAARGNVSFAAGMYARANHCGSFVWSDSAAVESESVYTSNSNQFRVRARGGIWFYSNAGRTTGVRLAANGTSWVSIGADERIGGARPVDGRVLLEKVASLPVSERESRDQSGVTRSIGPTARDFHAAFGYGLGDGINMADADGVTLAAIQALYEQNQMLSKRVAELEAKLDDR